MIMYDYRSDIQSIREHTTDDPNSLITSAYAIKTITNIIINEQTAATTTNDQ